MINQFVSGTATGFLRIAISFIQGLMLWGLFELAATKSWPANDRELFAALSAATLFVPIMAISGLGNLRKRTLLVWIVVATLLCAGLALHAAYRAPAGSDVDWALPYWASINLALAGLLFVCQSLVVAGDGDRKWIATFPTYFDVAWRHATQLALACLFIGVFVGLLFLGAALFELIKVDFLSRLLRKSWFWHLAITLSFGAALHFTDTRAAMVRGTRTLVLSLLSWLMPIMVLFAVGFLCTLPVTGLEPLWSTRHATPILLTTAIILILLVNAHFQDGGSESHRFAVLVYTRAAAAITLLPLTVLAAVGLGLRVDQYGWTESRIVALAFVIAVACHAVGYFIAVTRSRTALYGLPPTNVLSAFAIVGLMIALLTPLADSARLAVKSQVGRLESGAISPAAFDFGFLHFGSGRYGMIELERLRNKKDGPNAAEIAAQATLETKRVSKSARDDLATASSRQGNITVRHPSDAKLPRTFLQTSWSSRNLRIPNCLTVETARCDALLVDLDGDGGAEILLIGDRSYGPVAAFKEVAPGSWEFWGTLLNAECRGVVDALRQGNFQITPSTSMDLTVGDQRLQLKAECR